MSRTRLFAALAVLSSAFLTSGCESEAEAFVNDYNDFTEQFENQYFQNGQLDSTSFAALPAGTATYNGFIRVDEFLETVVADARLTANFTNNAITMTTSNYNRFDINDEFESSTTGSLTMTDGVILDANGAAGFGGNVTGRVDGTSYNELIAGAFAGPSANGLFASSISRISGIPTGTLVITAER